MQVISVRPPSFVEGSGPDYDGHKSAPGCAIGLPLLKECKQDGALTLQIANRTTRHDTSRPTSRTTPTKRRAASLSAASAYDSSDESTYTPITPPPIIDHVHRYLQREKVQRKPYQRDGATTQERRCAENQLYPRSSVTLADGKEGKSLLKRRLEHLSSKAVAQAVLTKEADVEWRRLRTLTTAWEIYAMEQHQRFLHMVLEDDSETYASAASEPLTTSIQALFSCSTEELQERMEFCKVAYDSDATSFATGDDQLDLIEDIACSHFGDEPKNRWSVDGSQSICETSLGSARVNKQLLFGFGK
ncbi:hypothetical protein F4604DRAFT_1784213 [Suillus subluteus]|nr:hypothetical protein F4604DRAFT_1827219 [Suillus subluteus]KAG1863886.1 hypothetical protein F4604DRAFT_1784213 [Suillus subluteus]